MATINLGAIKFNWKGAYNSSTSYAVDDVVSSGGNSYVCIQAHSNQAVGNATAYWNIMSSAGTNGTNGSNGTDVGTVITTQGDILYRDGSGLARLPAGTSGQLLKSGGSGANPSWTNAPSGSVPIVETFNNTIAFFSTANYYSFNDVTALDTTITPSSASSKILVMVHLDCATTTHHFMMQFRIQRKIGSGSFGNTVTNGYSGNDSLASSRSARAEYDSNGGATLHGTYVDVPNTTSAVTYRIGVNPSSGGGTMYLNRNGSNTNNSSRWQRAYACKVIAIELKQ